MAFFSLTGRATRRQALRIVLLALMALLAHAVLRSQGAPLLAANLSAGIAVVLFAAAVPTLVRRLHDAGRSGLWALTAFIPVLGLLAMIAILWLPPAAREFQTSRNWPRIIGAAGLALCCVLGLARMIWQPFGQASTSMQPTLMAGDYLAVRPIWLGNAQRGELLIYRDRVRGVELVGRLIGLPGDTVQMVAGQIVLNGQPVPQTSNGVFVQPKIQRGPAGSIPRCGNDPVPEGKDCLTRQSTETLPEGRAYSVLNLLDDWPGDNTEPVTLSADQFFFLADNRDDSLDSRYDATVGGSGIVEAADIAGRVDVILCSAAGATSSLFGRWCSDRFMLRPS